MFNDEERAKLQPLLDTLESALDRVSPRYHRMGRKVPNWRGLRNRYHWREGRRRVIRISGIEPGSKKGMGDQAKLDVQRRIVEMMEAADWRTL